MTRTSIPRRASELIASSIVWDNHGCLPLREDPEFLPQLERYRSAGVSVASINIGYGAIDWADHVRIARFIRNWVLKRPERYRLVSTIDEIEDAKASGRLGIVFDVEGMMPIGGDIGRVAALHDLGVRWMLIAYNQDNAAGGGCMGDNHGLTPFGRTIIDEMERVGMVLCLSHASERTALEALDHGRKPAIFSHSNPAAATPHSRNISDRLMRACAAKGGVIGLSGIGPYLGATRDPVAALLRHLLYVVDLVGPDHVGLGLDYVFDRAELDAYVRANPALFPPDLDGGIAMVAPEAIPDIVEGLARAKLSDDDIRAIIGGNWLRVARTCWH